MGPKGVDRLLRRSMPETLNALAELYDLMGREYGVSLHMFWEVHTELGDSQE